MLLSEYLSRPGNVVNLAREIAVAPAVVSQWKNGTRNVPAARCPAVERATGGAVTCEELRPDLAEQWAYLRGTECPPKEAA
jgi:DNA-binding transcriptional regulator YdaS (Cro superfamily)